MRSLIVALGLALLAAPAVAQSTTATVFGTVYDAQKAALPGAVLIFTNLDTGLEREVTADRSGDYRAVYLLPGRYEVRGRRDGFTDFLLPSLTLAIGAEVPLSITLQVASVSQQVTVMPEASGVGSALLLGRTFTSREIDELPVTARDFISLALLTPGILADRSTGRNPNPTFVSAGQIGRNNTFLLDGLSLDDHFGGLSRGSLSLDAVKEFIVRSNNFSAEYGQASGAIVAAVTRSGTNRFMGRGFYYRRDDRWDATSAATRLVDPPEEKSAMESSVFGGFVGGPIVRDRAFFLGSVERSASDTESIVTSSVLNTFRPQAATRLPVRARNPQILGRVDLNLSNTQSLTVRYRFDRVLQTNQVADPGPPGLVSPERRHDATRRDQDFAVLSNQIIGSTTFNELRFQLSRRLIDQDVSNYSAEAAENHPGILLGQAPVVPARRTESRWQLIDMITRLVPDAAGDHALKAGVDVSVIRSDSYGPGGFNGIWRFTGLPGTGVGANTPFDADLRETYPSQYLKFSGDPYSVTDTEVYALFFEDLWKPVPRLTLSLGLRWDYEHTFGIAGDRDNLAPRLGVAFSPRADGNTVLRGGYGIYYDAVLFRALTNSTSGDRISSITINNPGYPDPGSPSLRGRTVTLAPNVNRMAPTLRTPLTHQASVGVRHALANFAVSVDGVWAQGYNLLRTRDLNYPDLDDPLRRRPDSAYNRIRIRETEGHSWYRALLVGLQKRHEHRHSYGLAYTFSRSERDTEDWEFLPNDQRDYGAERGPASSDARHRLAANLNWDLPLGLRFGAVLTAYSALPYNITAGDDLNGDGESAPDRQPGVGRNSGRGDDFWQLDVRVSKAFVIDGRRLELLVEAFNVTNHVNWTDYDGNQLSPTFRQATAAGIARQIQLGIRVGF